ncbi:MAG: hypothetical protein K6B40_00050 [Firmicutes bacterium]|nr:hypothetical protein [Bacillota bacterium]
MTEHQRKRPSKNKKKFKTDKLAVAILAIVAIALAAKLIVTLIDRPLDLVQVENVAVYPNIPGEAVTLRSEYVATAPQAGVFTPSLEPGQRVKKDSVLGSVQTGDTDAPGPSVPVYSPAGGVVFYQLDGWEDTLRPGSEEPLDWLQLLEWMRQRYAGGAEGNAGAGQEEANAGAAENGDVPNMSARRPVARIVDNLLDFQIFFYAGENDVTAMEEGRQVMIRWDKKEEDNEIEDAMTPATIIEKGDLQDGSSFVLLSVSSAEDRLFSQRYALCQLAAEELHGLTVPVSAVFQEDAKSYVYIRKKNYVTRREVDVVYRDEEIAMVEGLSATDFVVANPGAAREGKQID